jgi:putative sterol carrier protein
MVNYGTLQWWQELRDKFNADDKLKNELLKGYTSDIIFRVSDKPNLDQYKGIYVNVKNGVITEVRVCANRDERAKVVTEGKYDTWKKIVMQTTDPTKVLITRKIKIAGPMGELLKYMKGWLRLLDLLKEVPTEWE